MPKKKSAPAVTPEFELILSAPPAAPVEPPRPILEWAAFLSELLTREALREFRLDDDRPVEVFHLPPP